MYSFRLAVEIATEEVAAQEVAPAPKGCGLTCGHFVLIYWARNFGRGGGRAVDPGERRFCNNAGWSAANSGTAASVCQKYSHLPKCGKYACISSPPRNGEAVVAGGAGAKRRPRTATAQLHLGRSSFEAPRMMRSHRTPRTSSDNRFAVTERTLRASAPCFVSCARAASGYHGPLPEHGSQQQAEST